MKLVRGVGYWLAAVVCSISWVVPVQGTEEALAPQEAAVEEEGGGAEARVGGAGVDVEVFGSIALAYDDNVFRYSDADRETFNLNNATRQTQFRHVNHIDDIVTVPRLGIGLKKTFIDERPTEVSFATTMHLYGADTVKNYEEYEFDLKQRLGTDLIGRVGYSYTPEFALRNLFDTDQPSGQEYKLATYSRHTLQTSVWHRFTPIVRGRVGYEAEFKDYNSFFNERDNTSHLWDVTGYFHLTDRLTWVADYEIGFTDAEANDDDAAVDPDIASFQQGFGTHLDVEVLKSLIVRPFYTFSYRSFTTNNSSADDRLHRDRNDIRQTLGIRAAYELSKDGEAYVQWERHANNTDISVAAGVSGDTDVLGFDQDVFTVGLTFRL